MGEREELRLITSEAELRVGMLVAIKPCAHCQGQHRGMLLRIEPADGRSCGNCDSIVGSRWVTTIGYPHDFTARTDEAGHLACIVAMRILYEVSPFQDDEAERERARWDDEIAVRNRALALAGLPPTKARTR